MTLLFYSFSDRQYKSNDTQNAAINYSGSTGLGSGSEGGGSDEPESDPTGYLLVCTIFTYVFTAIVYYFLFKETGQIIRTRQRCLGSQRTLSDRTIHITNIPEHLMSEDKLREHIESLGVGTVDKITLVHDYSLLNKLFAKRKAIIQKLEVIYSSYYGLKIDLLKKHITPCAILKICEVKSPVRLTFEDQSSDLNVEANAQTNTERTPLLRDVASVLETTDKPMERLTLFGPKVDIIEHYAKQLVEVDNHIMDLKSNREFRYVDQAFVTMDSVSDAQMAAQAVFSPNVFQLITKLAPSPQDVNWDYLLLTPRALFVRKNVIEVIIIAFSATLIMPIRYLTSLLNVNTIKKMWPEFGAYLLKHDYIRTVFTGLLPTYLFTLLNVILPYVISFLSNKQGLGSKGDVELSVIRKNFLYIFFNLFLVFTLFGTLSSYKALLTDTTKIAPLLASSMKSLSLFYVDLILLQGLTMFPFKLLQIGDLFFIFWQYIIKHSTQTPRNYRDLFYKPSIFEVGLILPQHILIFIITLIYSVMSTKILASGLAYFVLGYYVYKYQLVYTMVHPHHSTGKAWPIIFRRVCLGLFFLQMQTFGTLALEQSFVLAGLIVPLFPTILIATMFFNRNYLPLLNYIALDAIHTAGDSVESDEDVTNSILPDSSLNQRGSSGLLRTVDSPDSDSLNSDCAVSPTYEPQAYTMTVPPEEIVIHQNMSNPHLRKRRSTIDEEREQFQSYSYPYLSDPMDGPWIGFVGDYIDTVSYDIMPLAASTNNPTVGSLQTVVSRKKNTTIEYD
ncbi:unnamed protein product [Ambrosiozyma monospora]|uniref:Unnamed protein product n=1 Tax=Ambrosiozyma monospora TaxID=43982 RepID=A0A9W7DGE4_AMBMO|nr:unnamed protein product [Ambrosiozyma monospora]